MQVAGLAHTSQGYTVTTMSAAQCAPGVADAVPQPPPVGRQNMSPACQYVVGNALQGTAMAFQM